MAEYLGIDKLQSVETNQEIVSVFKTLLTRSRKYLTSVSWILLAIETLMALVSGGLVSIVISEGKYIPLAAIAVVIYLTLLGHRIYTQSLFPASLFGHLEAQEDLKDCRDELSRRERLFSYIDSSIQRLNEQTCFINQQEWESLCTEPIKDSLAELIDPLISLPQYVLACNSATFTVAARIGHQIQSDNGLNFKEHIVVFRDDLNLESELIENENGNDAFSDMQATGIRSALRNSMHETFNENRYCVNHNFNSSDSKYTYIGAPIPLICEEPDAGGVLFIVTNIDVECPCDIPDVLQIYGRLIANWLSKYDDCLENRANGLKLLQD